VSQLRRYLSDEYGGLRPFGALLWSRFLSVGGIYRRVSPKELASVSRLVFVCKGNICRSPYAEVKARELGLDAISAGLDTSAGKPANAVAESVARSRGVDLSAHRTQLLSGIALAPSDLILVMEPEQLGAARVQITANVPISLLGLYARPSRPYLQDPFGRSAPYFGRCYDVIDDALIRLELAVNSHRF